MLDIKLIRENPDIVRKDLKKRGDAEKLGILEELIQQDKKLLQKKQELENLRKEKNVLSEKINKLKKAGKSAENEIAASSELVRRISSLEAEVGTLEGGIKKSLMRLPNILHHSVPQGKDEGENVETKKWGKVLKFKFAPHGHEEIALGVDGLDIERAAKISGARFFFLKNELVLLDLALQHYAVEFLIKKGFKLLEPPFLMRRAPYEGVTDLGDFETVMYKTEGEDLYLIATSEHPMIASYMDEVIDENRLPIKHAGVSACFRKEAGAHGKDTKGIFRVHQFNKVEQVVICDPKDSWRFHEELLRNTELLFQGLKLPYRVVNVCTGDIGTVAAKKYDIELWFPAQGRYREAASCSNCTDYQARRLNIRYGKPGLPGQPFVHTLNQTGIATPRTMAAILENFQQADGSVKLPQALWKYMGGIKVLKPLKPAKVKSKRQSA